MDAAVLNVLDHGKFILGPEVKELEAEIAKYSDVSFGIGVNSGTDALLLPLRAIGVGYGDEVITTNYSFFATAGVISRLGAKPVFVDIEADSYNIDPNLIEAAITDKTKAIIPVHLYGQMADMDAIMAIANKHKIPVIEDGAQSIGVTYKDRLCGSIGTFGCFSFFPSKNLGGIGDGGMIVTNDEELADKCRMLRVHGGKPKYYHKIVGYNSRLATIQAAAILVKLPHLKSWSERRQKNAAYYGERFAGSNVVTPTVKDYTTFHIYNQYTIAVENRDQVIAKLREKKIGCEIYYPVPFHMQECFADLGYKPADFPRSTKAGDSVMSIPIFPELTEAERAFVADTVLAATG
ncbi:DegT/DnrJ/EryC1/StrS family aminotransferase [Gemmatimonas aurantiaca]|nr:DegT/DnrJ/EryC1/StrS family aminotransferase [Gemmatimonas aurantiaca]